MQEMAAEYEVAVVTMSKAIATLKEEGLITAKPGLGMLVNAPARRKTGLIGMVMERPLRYMSNSLYASQVIMGIQEAVAEAGCSVLFLGTPDEIIEKGNTFDVDGFCCYEVECWEGEDEVS